MKQRFFTLRMGEGPICAFAIHDGHALRDQVARRTALTAEQRLREEDPHTGRLAELFPSHVVVHRSRFEVDLNRSVAAAIYRKPEDAWGLNLWNEDLDDAHIQEGLALYQGFYDITEALLKEKVRRHERCLVLDLHSYNHRRDGAEANPAPELENPEINVGLSNIDLETWGPLVDQFCERLADLGFDVRKNVRFNGGRFSRWVNERFPLSACALALEFKKVFMDEWTGELYEEKLLKIGAALQSTTDDLRKTFWAE